MLNYSALTDPLLPQDVRAFKAQQSETSLMQIIITVIFYAFVGGSIFMSVAVGVLFGDNVAMVIVPAVFALIVCLGGVVLWLSVRKRVQTMARLYKFAVQNRATFTCVQLDPVEVGAIFGEGDGRRVSPMIDFVGGLRVANYKYATGSGDNRQTEYWTYARIPLERHVPNMVLDAKSNNLFRRFSNLPIRYKKAQVEKINAEFDALYTLYVPENYEQDAYYVLTPDVLAVLVDTGGVYDIEIVDNYIYFYSQSSVDLTKKENWERLLRVVGPISKEFREQVDYYADAKSTASRAVDSVAPEGRRLKKSIVASAVMFTLFIVGYLVFFVWSGFAGLRW